MLLILNLPLVGAFAKIAMIRPQILMIIAGVVGLFLRKWKYPIAPFIIGVVLGPTTENSLRQTFLMFRGDLSLVADRPISVTFLALAAAFLAFKFAAPFFGKKFPLKIEEESKL